MKGVVLPIIIGFLAIVIVTTAVDHVLHVTGIYPPYGEPMLDNKLLALAFIYRAVFAIAGTYLAAYLAKENASKAAWTLGIVGTILWIAGSIAMWDKSVAWYNLAGTVTSIPFSLIGLKIYQKKSTK